MSVPSIPAQAATRPPPWGYLATLGWALMAAVLGIVAAALAFFPWLAWDAETADTTAMVQDARVLAYVLTVTAVASIGVLALAARIRSWPVTDYLGFVPPDRRKTAIAVAILLAVFAVIEGATYLLGYENETQFDRELFLHAQTSGTMPLLLYTLVVVAPIGEETMFRGFLQRGWLRSRRDAIPAIVLISAIWASLHTQYNWYGMLEIFGLGLMFGWVRWWSGSTLLTMLLHAVANAMSTVEELILIDWFS